MRRYLPLLLLFVCLQTARGENSEKTPQDKTPKVGLVLGGGGAKGVAHIGVLKVLERAGFPIDIITSTSMGSIIGGAYACGHPSAVLDSIVRSQDWAMLLSDRESSSDQDLQMRQKHNTYIITKTLHFGKKLQGLGGGFIRGKNITPLFNRITAPYNDSIDFNTLPIRFACVATNIVDNTEYVFHSGVLSQAMRASMAIPGVFAPVRMDGMVLIDGGMRNNFPADIAREMGADYVIGVDVQDVPKPADKLQTGTQILAQISDWLCMNKYEENKRKSDIVIRVNTDGYSAASFNAAAIDTLIRRGEEAAMAHWDELIALRQKLGPVSQHRITHGIQTEPPLAVEEENDNRKRKDIEFNLGVRFDKEEAVALQANIQTPIRTKMPMDLELTLRLGKRLKAQVDWTLHPTSFFQPTISYIYRNNDIDFYENGDKTYTFTYDQHSVKLSLFNFNVRNFNVSIGANYDYYHYRSLLANNQTQQQLSDEDARNKGYISYQGRVWYNSENKWYFPTNGVRFQAKFAYYTDNFIELNGKAGISEYAAMFRSSFPLSNKFSFQPMVYGRFLQGSDIPVVINNLMGGEWFDHYVEGQTTFAGVGNLEMLSQNLAVAQMQVQFNPTTNNNILLRVSAGQDAQKFKNLFDHRTMIGGSLSYYYTTMLGPLGGSVGYSNLTKKFYFYINLGFVF